MNWVLMKNKLEPEEVILLRLVGSINFIFYSFLYTYNLYKNLSI